MLCASEGLYVIGSFFTLVSVCMFIAFLPCFHNFAFRRTFEELHPLERQDLLASDVEDFRHPLDKDDSILLLSHSKVS
jgi:hypothetical protein